MCVSLPDRVDQGDNHVVTPTMNPCSGVNCGFLKSDKEMRKNSYEEFRYFFGEFFREFIFREQRSIIRITSAVVRGELSKVIRGHSEVTREHYHHQQQYHHKCTPYFCFALFELFQELFLPFV